MRNIFGKDHYVTIFTETALTLLNNKDDLLGIWQLVSVLGAFNR